MDANSSVNSSISRKILEWRLSPLQFVRDCIDAIPTDQQIEGLLAAGKYKRITIRSGHGTGKDAFASWIIMWFETCWPYSKTAATAPTARQLSDILWSELAKWIRKSKLADEYVIQKDKIFKKESPKEWWVRAISPSVKASKEEQAETLAGLHGDNLLIVVDEASGVPDPMFVPLEGALTGPNNRVLLIGNMTRGSGYFFDTHFHIEHKKAWFQLHWDSSKSSNVDPGYPKYMADKYGISSNIYRIRVQGDPPLADDTVYIPLHWAEQCIGKEIEIAEDEPLYLCIS